MAGAETIGAGISSADDDHVLPSRNDLVGVANDVAFVAAILLWQKFYRKMNSSQLAPRDGEIARLLGTTSEEDSVESAAKVTDIEVHTDVCSGDEFNPFL